MSRTVMAEAILRNDTTGSPVPSSNDTEKCKDTSKSKPKKSVKNEDILFLLKEMQEEQKQQRTKVEALSDTVNTMSQDFYYSENENNNNDPEQDQLEQVDNLQTDNATTQANQACNAPVEIEQNDGTVGTNVENTHENTQAKNSRFAKFADKFHNKEKTDASVDSVFADTIQNLFTKGLSDEEQKDLCKKFNRPENCPALVAPRVNQPVWTILRTETKSLDSRFQHLQECLIKASCCLTNHANTMAQTEQDTSNIEDALALLGHTNREINLRRRECIKPDLSQDFLHLCSPSVPFTNYLFGDNVTQTVNDIQSINKVSNRVGGRGRGFRGRTRHQSRNTGRGRGRGRTYVQRFGPYPNRPASYQPYPRYTTYPTSQRGRQRREIAPNKN